ncbi:DUF4310 family protein [Paenibacillus sp. 481]|uniref:DUF4310 family protein n=1 Tax=Paenibacillus sp. 481 TaxID=2835869 RepID=UPI001E31DE3D|nr:DUF4310 family protein [Paenibacillus sp. 481]UHA74247.1 DUF4310 family protein [Paenibacillus sp. 481]
MQDNVMELKKNFWFAEWSFVLFVALTSAGIFAGTHMYYVYQVGAFNDIAVVAMLKSGMDGGAYGAAAAFGASFLFARILEGPLVGILDIGGALQTGLGIGVPAMLLAAGITLPMENFVVALMTGTALGAAVGGIIIGIRKFTINAANSTFGADVMMGAGNAAGRYLGPLIMISAATASIPAGIGATIGAALFYAYKKPIAGGAILGAMLAGYFFPITG